MKVVWSPNGGAVPVKSHFYNVWYKALDQNVWMDPTPYNSIQNALDDKEKSEYKRIAILEIPA